MLCAFPPPTFCNPVSFSIPNLCLFFVSHNLNHQLQREWCSLAMSHLFQHDFPPISKHSLQSVSTLCVTYTKHLRPFSHLGNAKNSYLRCYFSSQLSDSCGCNQGTVMHIFKKATIPNIFYWRSHGTLPSRLPDSIYLDPYWNGHIFPTWTAPRRT